MLATASLGRYGPYGPPFTDPELQATYVAEVKNLASNALITTSTAGQIVATVMNSALAAGEAAIPAITAAVRKAAGTAAAKTASKAAYTAAHDGAALGAAEALLYGTLLVGLLGDVTWALTRTVSAKT